MRALPPLLAVLLAAPLVEAATIRIGNVRVNQSPSTRNPCLVVTTTGDELPASLTAELTAEGGRASLTLEASEVQRHGAATLDGLPLAEASLTLTIRDAHGARIATLTGTLTADGAVTLVTPESGGDCTSRVGCDGDGTRTDLRAVGARTFWEADGRLGFAVDLAGAGAAAVSGADLAVTEVRDREPVTTTAAVTFGAPEYQWIAELPADLDGMIDARVTAWDADGRRIDRTRVDVAAAWDDGRTGTSPLPIDNEPLTSVALQPRPPAAASRAHALTLVSDGWHAGERLPTHAEVALDRGATWTLPVNSYQRTASTPIAFEGDPEAERFEVTVDGQRMDAARSIGGRGLCQYGKCVCLARGGDGGWTLSVTAYAPSPDLLPAGAILALNSTKEKAAPTEAAYPVTFDSTIAVVFAAEVDTAGDGTGTALTGKVRLRANNTLLVGHFAGQLGADDDGDLGLAAIDPRGPVQSKGDILIGGEPIGIERTAGGTTILSAPPAVVLKNGTGTRNTQANTGQTQQTHLL